MDGRAGRPPATTPISPRSTACAPFAVGAVLLYHAGQSWAIGGYLGVDAFFVLSGFLITTLLVTEWGARGRIDLAAFWVRRAKRLLPALGVVILGIAFYAAVFAAPAEVGRIRGDGIGSLFYVANWRFVFSGQSYFDQFTQPSPFRHMWSLAIEEQFYLLWPLIVFGVLWFTRSLRWLLGVSVAMIAASAGLMALLYEPGTDPSRVVLRHRHPRAVAARRRGGRGPRVPARPDPIGARPHRGCASWHWSARRTPCGCGRGCRSAPTRSTRAASSSPRWRSCSSSCRSPNPTRGVLGSLLSLRPLRWIGMISYGLYLWHWPVYLTLTTRRTGIEGTSLLLTRLAVSVAFATVSFYLVERPIRRGTLRLPRPIVAVPALAGALVLALVLTTSGGGPSVASETVRALDRRRPPRRRRRLPPRRRPTTPPARDAGVPVPVPLVPHRPTACLLVGDSVAASLGLGLERAAAASNGELVVWNKATLGCGMLRQGEVDIGQEPVVQEAICNDWDTRWVQPIIEFQPNVVVLLTGAWDLLDRKIAGEYYSPGTIAFDRYFLAELDQASQLLAAQGRRSSC